MALMKIAMICSSADVNPIGSFSKIDLKAFLEWAGQEHNLGYSALIDVVRAAPTAELEPITENYTQTDEGTPIIIINNACLEMMMMMMMQRTWA